MPDDPTISRYNSESLVAVASFTLLMWSVTLAEVAYVSIFVPDILKASNSGGIIAVLSPVVLEFFRPALIAPPEVPRTILEALVRSFSIALASWITLSLLARIRLERLLHRSMVLLVSGGIIAVSLSLSKMIVINLQFLDLLNESLCQRSTSACAYSKIVVRGQIAVFSLGALAYSWVFFSTLGILPWGVRTHGFRKAPEVLTEGDAIKVISEGSTTFRRDIASNCLYIFICFFLLYIFAAVGFEKYSTFIGRGL